MTLSVTSAEFQFFLLSINISFRSWRLKSSVQSGNLSILSAIGPTRVKDRPPMPESPVEQQNGFKPFMEWHIFWIADAVTFDLTKFCSLSFDRTKIASIHVIFLTILQVYRNSRTSSNLIAFFKVVFLCVADQYIAQFKQEEINSNDELCKIQIIYLYLKDRNGIDCILS